MLWSRFFIPTTKETPADAATASHRLAVRAGLIRPAATGSYTYLPLGLRVLRKIERIAREEMSAIGGMEMAGPSLQPLAWWQQTGRDVEWGPTLVRLGGGDWQRGAVLGAAHEEAFTELARACVNSYKQLPLLLYQIRPVFRGEERPHGGLLRLREFQMLEACSWHDDAARLDGGYQALCGAVGRVLTRCGLSFVVAEAEPGPTGGNESHEFIVLSEAGDDLLARSEDAAYAANVERAGRQMPTMPPDPAPADMQRLEEVHTPGCAAIEDVCRFLAVPPERMLKTLVYQLGLPAGATSTAQEAGWNVRLPRFLVVCVRGDHEVNEAKLRRLVRERGLGSEPSLSSLDTAAEAGFVIGYVGPHAANAIDCVLVIDPDARAVANAVSGANRREYHVQGFNWVREVMPERLGKAVIADIRTVREGDPAPHPPAASGSRLRLERGIEVGHVFRPGTRYSQPFGARILDGTGRPCELVMGSCGLGLDRLMAAVIETHHDVDGICWPMSIAPFEVIITTVDARDAAVHAAAAGLHDQLAAHGVDVLLDDRDERPGFKFKDADLIGVPLRITVGKKVLADGAVELKERGGVVERFAVHGVVKEVCRRVQTSPATRGCKPAGR